jgi:hypothetical protein
MAKPMSDKQEAFLRKLASERLAPGTDRSIVEANGAEWLERMLGQLNIVSASPIIDAWLKLPKVVKTKPVHVPLDLDDIPLGMHVGMDGEFYKVGKTRKGHVVAKRLDPRLVASTGNKRGAFLYVGQTPFRSKIITVDTVMTAAQAAQFGGTWGFCVNCAAQLDDPRSVAAGYGPVCARNNGWPWGNQKTTRRKAAGDQVTRRTAAPNAVIISNVMQ